MTDQHTPALQLSGIAKSFGSVRALEHVDFSAWPGEIHAIVGDNGAGKSTMLKIVTGIHDADAGEVRVNGSVESSHNAKTVQDLGVAVVYQDLALVECLDIAQNLSLGNLPRRWGIILDRQRMARDAAKVLSDLKVRVGDVHTPVGLLSGGQRQIIAIARAVRMDKPLILLDEPTAALGVQESARVGTIMRELRAAGKAVVCISHDLEFVFAHADRITVLRLGNSVGTRRTADTTRDEIVGLITGAFPADGRPARAQKEAP
ncbi:ATP-binding cassette domain-containing protein [Asanoa sp. NPDC050611]|uniref:ATP-binding cassette domain-containing protein n=1 Tax=Asanoa sp. NPDC050611 TaxID=3157098 RepID=UPI0033D219D3